MKQNGQIVLVLILIMTVAFAIGISVVQRSLSDVSTATKQEQSSRAFSAAEAGIERALSNGASLAVPDTETGNQSSATVISQDFPGPGQALEYPPIGKEEIAQFWLAKPSDLSAYYKQSSLNVYWGNFGVAGRERPAIELTIIYQDPSGYQQKQFFYDPVETGGRDLNHFLEPTSPGCPVSSVSPTGFSTQYLCKVTISGWPLPDSSHKLVFLRARLLYNNTSQKLAVEPVGICGPDCSLPTQAKLLTSTGVAGETERKVQLFKENPEAKVVPFFFNYAIFSVGEINK